MEIPINIGDLVYGGRFKNKKIIVKSIGKDIHGQPTINGKPLLKVRIAKLMNKESILKEYIDTEIREFIKINKR